MTNHSYKLLKQYTLWATIVNLLLLLVVACAFAETYNVDEIVEAIGKAENSQRYPFGIKSIDTKGDYEYARKICYNSVVNNYRRWIKAGKKGGFLEFMAKRYCPVNAHKLNKNWIANIKYWLVRNRKEKK